MRFEVYRGEDGQWYWRLRAGNGRIVAVGGEGYARKRNAKRALNTVAAVFRSATNVFWEVDPQHIVDVTR